MKWVKVFTHDFQTTPFFVVQQKADLTKGKTSSFLKIGN